MTNNNVDNNLCVMIKKNVQNEVPLYEDADVVLPFLLPFSPSIENVFNKAEQFLPNMANVFLTCFYFPEGLLLVKTPIHVTRTKRFHGRFRATYHDAHRKSTHPKSV